MSALLIGEVVRNGGAVFLAALWGFWAFVFQGMGYHSDASAMWAVGLWLLWGAAFGSLLIDWFAPSQAKLGTVLFWIAAAPLPVVLVYYFWPR